MSSINTTQIDGDVSVGRNVALGGDAHIAGSSTIGHNLKVEGWLDAANIKGVNRGVFLTVQELREAYPNPHDGWFAGVGSSTPFTAYVGKGGDWVATGGTIDVEVDIHEIDDRLDALESDVDEAGTDISGLRTRLGTAEGKITSLETKATQNEAGIEVLTTWCGGLDTRSMANMNKIYALNGLEEETHTLSPAETASLYINNTGELINSTSTVYAYAVESGDVLRIKHKGGTGVSKVWAAYSADSIQECGVDTLVNISDGTINTDGNEETEDVVIPDGVSLLVACKGSSSGSALSVSGVQTTSRIDTLVTRVTQDESTISEHGTRLSTAEGKITSQGTRLATAEGKITSQGTRLTTAEGNITSQGTRLGTAEAKIETLETRATQDEGNSTHYSLVGNGDTRVGIQLGQRLKPATSYVVLFRGDWAVDEITLAASTSRFRVLSNDSAISKSGISIAANVPIAKYFTVPADSERTSVSILANAGEKVEFDIVKTNVFSPVVYFSNRQYPTFERLVNKIKVTFPTYIKIHDEATGVAIAGFNVSGQSFELEARQRLVYDLADGTLKVVLVEDGGDYINLLVSYGDKYCGGLLAHYLDNQRFAVVNDKLNLVKWEIGALNFLVTPWTYSDANNRVRVAQNDYLHLNKGDIITLTDYANAKMYVAWITDGVYGSSSGWLQEDFVCETDGDYSMLLAYVDNSVVGDASELSGLVKIIPVWSTLDDKIAAVNEKADAVDAKADGLDLGVLNPDMFDIGEVNLNATPWTYSDGTRSVRLKEEAKLFLKTGDVIRLTDYSNCMIFISYRNGEDYYRTGWLTSGSFVCPMDAEYSMLMRHPSSTFGNVVADKWQFLRYLRIERGKECPFDIAKQSHRAFAWLMDNPNLRAVNHRGYNTIAPENTLSAFRLSAEMGFKWVELDVQWTSDGVPVILHDATIDRTSNGTGAIKDLRFVEVRQYDFGSWKSEEYAGEQIPTFEEALLCCKWAGLKIYVEIKTATLTDAQADLLALMIKGTGMSDACDFIQANSANVDALKKMGARFPQARLGYVKPTASTEAVALARIDELLPPNHTAGNKVFADLAYGDSVLGSSTFIPALIERGVELELWDCRYSRDIVSTYVTGVTINSVITNQGLNGA